LRHSLLGSREQWSFGFATIRRRDRTSSSVGSDPVSGQCSICHRSCPAGLDRRGLRSGARRIDDRRLFIRSTLGCDVVRNYAGSRSCLGAFGWGRSGCLSRSACNPALPIRSASFRLTALGADDTGSRWTSFSIIPPRLVGDSWDDYPPVIGFGSDEMNRVSISLSRAKSSSIWRRE
jgi:hypothetical protein